MCEMLQKLTRLLFQVVSHHVQLTSCWLISAVIFCFWRAYCVKMKSKLTETLQDIDVWINNNKNPYELMLTHLHTPP